MLKVITRTPFGFVLELTGASAYYSEHEYTLRLNGQVQGRYRQNLTAIFGLTPDTDYEITVTLAGCDHHLPVRTEAAGYVIDVRDHNAAGDGRSDDTAALNMAVYLAPPGSVVRFARGTYRLSHLLLKSGVDLYLEAGCVLQQQTDRTQLAIMKGYQRDYHHRRAVVGASWEGNPLDTYGAVICGHEISDVRIYGPGVIDGSGAQGGWWERPKEKRGAYRPKNVFLNRCRRILLAGFTSRNSAGWNLHPFYCEQLQCLNLRLESAGTSPNTDGIDPESCREVFIAGCHFAVGDDCIALKSGKYFMSQYDCRPCEQVHIYNCYMGAGHGGVAIGSELSGGVRRILIENCYMAGTERGLRIKTRRGRGRTAVVNDVILRGVQMTGVTHAFAVNMFYNCDPDGKSDQVKDKTVTAADAFTPAVRDIRLERVTATGLRGCAVFVYGLPEQPLTGLHITGCRFAFAADRTDVPPELLEDFTAPAKLGVFIKNADRPDLTANEFQGAYVQVREEEVSYESGA